MVTLPLLPKRGVYFVHKIVAVVVGLGLLALGVFGLLSGNGRLFGLLNTDFLLDMLRLGIGGLLLYAVYIAKNRSLIHRGLLILAFANIGLALFGLLNRELLGALPTGFNDFDIATHLLFGAVVLALVLMMKSAKKIADESSKYW